MDTLVRLIREFDDTFVLRSAVVVPPRLAAMTRSNGVKTKNVLGVVRGMNANAKSNIIYK